MHKRLVLLSRKPGTTALEFFQHWEGPHAEIIKSIIAHFPDMEQFRYRQNRVLRPIELGRTDSPCAKVDGLVELNLTAPKPPPSAADAGTIAHMLEDELRFLGAFCECNVEFDGADEEVPDAAKYIYMAKRSASTTRDEFESKLRHTVTRAVDRSSTRICFNWVVFTVSRENLLQLEAPDVLIEFWDSSPVLGPWPSLGILAEGMSDACEWQCAVEVDPLVVL